MKKTLTYKYSINEDIGWLFFDKNGFHEEIYNAIGGFDIELLEHIAKGCGFKFEYIEDD